LSTVFRYRVYVVMTPQTHLTVVLDDEAFVEGVLTNLEAKIATAIQNVRNAGKNVTAAQAAFNDPKAQVSAAQNETNGPAAHVLAQTPQGYPENAGFPGGTHTHATNAHNDLRSAYTNAEHIRSDLK
jgi:multidrug resistance efflux pump